MIDTVYAFINCRINPKILRQHCWENDYDHEDPFKNHSYINFSGVRFEYYPMKGLVFFKASIPKVLYGRNDIPVKKEDIPVFFDIVKSLASQLLQIPIPDISKWEASRVDYKYDFYARDVCEKHLLINVLKCARIPRHERIDNELYTWTVECTSKSSTIRIYSKSDDPKSRFADERLIRIEYQLNRRKIRGFKETTLGYFLQQQPYQSSMKKLFNNMNLFGDIYPKEQVKSILNKVCSPSVANNLFTFLTNFNNDAKNAFDLNPQMYNRRLIDLQALGICPYWLPQEGPVIPISKWLGL